MTQKAVILLNLGGPDDLDGVEPFLVSLFSDVISLPWGKFGSRTLGKFIASHRKKHSQQLYGEIGGRSPILKETRAQADALQTQLGHDYAVHVAMRYSSPTIEEIQLELIQHETPWQEIIVLPLFPQSSFATTRTCQQEWARNSSLNRATTFIQSFHDHPDYIAAIRELIDQTVTPPSPGEPCHVLFSAHSMPESFIAKGDVYQSQIEETVRLVMDGLPYAHSLAYQSKVGPVKWLGPTTANEIVRLGQSGITDLAVVPIAFVCEHLETLHELDILLSEVAQDAGITNYMRVPALGTHPKFIDALADIVNHTERYTS